jgi:hypothetical protein
MIIDSATIAMARLTRRRDGTGDLLVGRRTSSGPLYGIGTCRRP